MKIYKVNPGDVIRDDGFLWFWSYKHNSILKMNEATSEVENVARYPLEEKDNFYKFKGIAKVDEYIVLASKKGKAQIVVYNLKEESWKWIALTDNPFGDEYLESDYCFMSCISYGRLVYAIGHLVPIIVQLNLDTFEVKYMTDWANGRAVKDLKKNPSYFAIGSVLNETAYIPMGCENGILKINLMTAENCVLRLPINTENLCQCSIIGDELWVIDGYKPMLYIYNLKSRELQEICLCEEEREKKLWSSYFAPIVTSKGVLVIPTRRKKACLINENTKEVYECIQFDKVGSEQTIYSFTERIIFADDKKVIFYSLQYDNWKVVDRDSMEIYVMELPFSDRLKTQMWEKRMKTIIEENQDWTLEEYCIRIATDFK